MIHKGGTVVENPEFRKFIYHSINECLEESAQVVQEKADRLCPVRTGFLRSTLMHTLFKKRHEALIGVTAYYGGFVELGTSRMTPRPFLRPALLDSWPEIRAIFSNRDKQLLRRLL